MSFRVTSDAEWDAAYWQWLALNKKRAWWHGWDWRIENRVLPLIQRHTRTDAQAERWQRTHRCATERKP